MTINVEFIRVLHDDPDTQRQALFRIGENHYMYSYVNNEMAHETMVFPCDDSGENINFSEVYASTGYVETDVAMQSVAHDYGHLSLSEEPLKVAMSEELLEKIAAADADEKIAKRKIAENHSE